jgi:PKHD-type hydroxylase
MILFIDNVISPDELALARDVLSRARFDDGKRTAGWSARNVKDNAQAAREGEVDRLAGMLAERIRAHPVFALAVRPKLLTPLILSRYEGGQAYGTHVDDALMAGVRTDVSFTLFLAEPDTYEGGELVMEGSGGADEIKLPAGALVAYPSTSLHRVAPVTEGARLAAVGWARSYIRSAEQRELLFDLDTARRALFEREGKSREFDLMSKSVANLIRMWAED